MSKNIVLTKKSLMNLVREAEAVVKTAKDRNAVLSGGKLHVLHLSGSEDCYLSAPFVETPDGAPRKLDLEALRVAVRGLAGNGDVSISVRKEDGHLLLDQKGVISSSVYVPLQLMNRDDVPEYEEIPFVKGSKKEPSLIVDTDACFAGRASLCRDVTRYNLHGTFVDVEKAVLVSTDGHRLSAVPFSVDNSAAVSQGLMIAVSTVDAAFRMRKTPGIQIAVNSVSSTLTTPDFVLISKPASADSFPKQYEQVLPDPTLHGFVVVTNKSNMQTFRTAKAACAGLVAMRLSVRDGEHLHLARSASTGGFETQMDVKDLGGAFPSISVNASYFLDALSQFPEGSNVRVSTAEDGMSPILFEALEGVGGRVVVMPIRAK